MEQNLIIQQEGFIATITINAPKTLNALNVEILNELSNVFDKLNTDESVRVIVITGTERSFVSGADIQSMTGMGYADAKAFAELGASVLRKIETLQKPVIASVNGYALGGGCELAMACDIRIASTKAKFGLPEVSLGITPGFSGTQRMSRLIGFAKAKELIFTGKIINAVEAMNIGLVNKVVEPGLLTEEVMTMAQAIAVQAPVAVVNAKKAINDGWDLCMEDGIKLEMELFARCFDTQDQKKGMKAFLNKQKTEFDGK
ncbi:MAG: 3-hydroxybutyryl-CoA dehydratase [Bacteroidetes bacterium]|nr:3-hydroxybutyryl-CoA dehydratase [Bacteroidota bacterium]